jgi:hypothetical protein
MVAPKLGVLVQRRRGSSARTNPKFYKEWLTLRVLFISSLRSNIIIKIRRLLLLFILILE